jgi:DivIVA domain-containing protein
MSDSDVPNSAEEKDGFGELQQYVPADLLNVTFPAAVRGYDRRTVDAYVARVGRVVAELKVSSSPPAAVRHALDRAGQQVQRLLQSARQTAEEITASARTEAEENTARAKAEAADLVVNTSAEADRMSAEGKALVASARAEAAEIIAGAKAERLSILAQTNAEAEERLAQLREELAGLRAEAEARMRELAADTGTVWDKRRELLDDLRAMASDLLGFASAAAGRLPDQERGEVDVVPEAEALDEPTSPASETDDFPRALKAVGVPERAEPDARDA